jgi:hypothetical protein
VRVDQAGEQGGVAQVDDFGALGMINRLPNGANAISLDQNFAGLEQGSGVNLEQARGVEDDGRGGWLLCGGEGRRDCERCAKKKGTKALRETRHG